MASHQPRPTHTPRPGRAYLLIGVVRVRLVQRSRRHGIRFSLVLATAIADQRRRLEAEGNDDQAVSGGSRAGGDGSCGLITCATSSKRVTNDRLQ